MKLCCKGASYAKVILLLLVVLMLQCCTSDKASYTIYTIGDSTMANKKQKVYPETGWCQVLGTYFDEAVTVENHAKNGLSSKSFIDEGNWQAVLDSLKAGDFVFIQFGHNDEKQYDSTRYTSPFDTYSENLEMFVNQSREKGASPVLFTPIVRRKFGEDGLLRNTHGDYPEAVRLLAEKLDVQMVDLEKLTKEWVNTLGDKPSKEMFLWINSSENFPEGKEDDTHLSEKGAYEVAKLAMRACISMDVPFAKEIQLEKN